MASELRPLRYLNRDLTQEELGPQVFAAANHAMMETHDLDDPQWFSKFRVELLRDLRRRKALVLPGSVLPE